jgi:glyoxylate/hydroxypyruvate reductase A
MSAILVAVDGPQAGEWLASLRAHSKGRDVRAWPDAVGNAGDIAYACVWLPPHGVLAGFPNLKAIINLGAGVDRLLADPSLPPVPIARVAHPDLTMRVTEYVVLHVLMHHRRQRLYDAQQREGLWRVHDQPAASDVTVGVMGLGVIGREAAGALARLGFQVAGWSRTPKSIPGVETFHGEAGLNGFLARTEILVCLLPKTPQTEGLLNLGLFRRLKRHGAAGGAFLINAARGRLQVDADIVAAMDEGTLAGCTLDVFPQEPLPPGSPLWSHPKITVTPHNAGDISPRVFAPSVIAQIERFERGLPLENAVDRIRGY